MTNGCDCERNIQQVKGVKIIRTFPQIDKDWKIEKYDTIIKNIYFFENQTMYNLSYQYDKIINGESNKSENRFFYFVFTNGEAFGSLFDKNKKIEAKKISVDSILKREFVMESEWFEEKKQNFARKVYSKFNYGLDSLEEIYIFRNPKKNDDTSTIGNFKLNFSEKVNKLNFSLSKRLDSLSGMKLYKYIITQYPIYYKEYDKFSDTMKIYYEMKELKIENEKFLINYFLKDKKANTND